MPKIDIPKIAIPDDIKKQIDEVRNRLLGTPNAEELNLLKAKIDALEALRNLRWSEHNDDVDEPGHHHHEHFVTD